ncbi:MAG: C4-type zinc ribbon domain-containing protein [Verrucomicrobiota bacterium]
MKELFQNLLQLQELQFGDRSGGSVEAAISQLRRKIPLPILEHYDRLTARGKTGLAAVRHQVCMGCHMRIPIGAIIRLMHAEDVQLCDNCGRYLYLPNDDRNELREVYAEATATAAKSRPKHKSLARAT